MKFVHTIRTPTGRVYTTTTRAEFYEVLGRVQKEFPDQWIPISAEPMREGQDVKAKRDTTSIEF